MIKNAKTDTNNIFKTCPNTSRMTISCSIEEIANRSNGDINKALLIYQYTQYNSKYENLLNDYIDFLSNKKNFCVISNLVTLRSYMRTLIVSKLPLKEILVQTKNRFVDLCSVSIDRAFFHQVFLLFIKFVNILLETNEISFSKQYQIELIFLFIPKFFDCIYKNDHLTFSMLQNFHEDFIQKYGQML